jgi:hypothetical protein
VLVTNKRNALAGDKMRAKWLQTKGDKGGKTNIPRECYKRSIKGKQLPSVYRTNLRALARKTVSFVRVERTSSTLPSSENLPIFLCSPLD